MAMPITTAILGLVDRALRSIAPARARRSRSRRVAPTLATMIGLGVGIDYALFIVTRHRGSIARRASSADESIARAVATVGRRRRVRRQHGRDRAAARSRSPASRSSARSATRAAVVVVVAVCGGAHAAAGAARLARPPDRLAARPVAATSPTTTTTSRTAGERWARGVGRQPLAAAVVAAIAILARARAAGRSTCGSASRTTAQLPKSTTARQAYDLLTKGFGARRQRPAPDRGRLRRRRRTTTRSSSTSSSSSRSSSSRRPSSRRTSSAQQLEAEGVPPDEAQQQAEAAGPAQQQAGAAADPAVRPAEEVPAVGRRAIPPRQAREARSARRRASSRSRRRRSTRPASAAVFTVIPKTGAVGRGDRRTWSTSCATTSSRRRSKGTDADRLRRRQTAGYIDLGRPRSPTSCRW